MVVSFWGFHLVKTIDNQEGLLDGYCVVSLLLVVLGAIIEISVGKPDSDKVGCWLQRTIGAVLNT